MVKARFALVVMFSVMAFGIASVSATEGTGIVFQTVANSFVPREAFILIEANSGEVKKYTAVAVKRNSNSDDEEGRSRLLIGAAVPYSSLSDKTHFSFFLKGPDGEFSATPVDVLTPETLMEGKKRISEVDTSRAVMERDRVSLQDAVTELEERLSVLRESANKIAGLDEIVDIKVELSGLKGIGEENSAESERLRALIDSGRKLQDPPDIKETLQELSTHLRETAQATALADRLNTRRRSAARSTLNKKITLIQEMRAVDSQTIAKETLRLRRKRRQLELQLGVGSAGTEREF